MIKRVVQITDGEPPSVFAANLRSAPGWEVYAIRYAELELGHVPAALDSVDLHGVFFNLGQERPNRIATWHYLFWEHSKAVSGKVVLLTEYAITANEIRAQRVFPFLEEWRFGRPEGAGANQQSHFLVLDNVNLEFEQHEIQAMLQEDGEPVGSGTSRLRPLQSDAFLRRWKQSNMANQALKLLGSLEPAKARETVGALVAENHIAWDTICPRVDPQGRFRDSHHYANAILTWAADSHCNPSTWVEKGRSLLGPVCNNEPASSWQ